MKRKLFITILLLIPFTFLQAQDENIVFEKVEVNANTDQEVGTEHIAKKIQFPDSVIKEIPAGTYKVNVQFVVDIHGNIGQAKAKNDPGFGLAKMAVEVISTYKGKWQPANQCGRIVKSYKGQPITFIVPAQ
jgi:protein TonB